VKNKQESESTFHQTCFFIQNAFSFSLPFFVDEYVFYWWRVSAVTAWFAEIFDGRISRIAVV
jgi:hypothetical protein